MAIVNPYEEIPIYVNPALEKLFGFSLKEFTDELKWSKIVPLSKIPLEYREQFAKYESSQNNNNNENIPKSNFNYKAFLEDPLQSSTSFKNEFIDRNKNTIETLLILDVIRDSQKKPIILIAHIIRLNSANFTPPSEQNNALNNNNSSSTSNNQNNL